MTDFTLMGEPLL